MGTLFTHWEEAGAAYVLGKESFLYLSPFNAVMYTTDHGVSWAQGGPDGSETIYKSTTGKYYMGSAQHGVMRSTDGLHWTSVGAGFQVGAVIGDGKRMFVGWASGPTWTYTSAESDGTTWTPIDNPPGMSGSAAMFAYDSGHHLLLSANTKSGLWRMVTY
jgi:hypothetical protein